MKNDAIAAVRGRQVWDSRGRPTVEADVVLESGVVGRAIAPAGASRGIYEAVELRDGGERQGGYGVDAAVANVNAIIAEALRGMDVSNQAAIDRALEDADGTRNLSRLGGNAIVAVSLAALHASAASAGVPLWRYLSGGKPVRIPLPEIQIFGGGAHAGRRTDIQDFMVMMPGADTVRHALEITGDVYRAAGKLMADDNLLAGTADEGGWWPNFSSNEQALEKLTLSIERAGYKPGHDVFISLDIASSEFHIDGAYRMGLDGSALDTHAMVSLMKLWCDRYPVISIEDPVGQTDFAGMVEATAALKTGAQVVGDDFLVTDATRVKDAAAAGACTTALIKVNQVGTVSRAKAALDAAKAAGWGSIVSARSGETEDISIAHLATGWDAGQIKVGSFARSERMAKWNELLRIEEELGADARFAGWDAFPKGIKR
ncbi:MAG TPA: phosphopyruvate hydratase [Rhizomicrobium sp.]|nr:phosphopyruvate hydratase [Rhizomicrobium sp.]